MEKSLSKVILYGGNGFLGCSLQEALVQHGCDVLVISPTDDPARNTATRFMSNSNGITDCLAKEVLACDVFIHLYSSSTPAFFDLATFCNTELFETLSILDLISKREEELLFIYLSSGGAIYGTSRQNISFKEGDPVMPISHYGASKLTIEQYIKCYSDWNPALLPVVLRPSNVYGFGAIKPGRNIVHTCFQKVLDKEELVIWGEGSSRKDYLYIEDFCSLVVKVLRAPVAGVYNVGSGQLYSVSDIITTVEMVTAQSIQTRKTMAHCADVGEFSLNIGKIQKTFHWNALVSLEEGVKEIWKKIKQGLH